MRSVKQRSSISKSPKGSPLCYTVDINCQKWPQSNYYTLSFNVNVTNVYDDEYLRT